MDTSQKSLESIGRQLKEIRESKKISQRAVMIRTGLAQKTISRIENGIDSPRLATIIKFAHAIGAELTLTNKEDQ